MKLELVKIADLKLDPNNARKHGNKNLKAISGSFKEFDQLKNIVINSDNVVIAGNGTVQSFIDNGRKEIWAHRTILSADKQKAFALADNRSAELAAWDFDILKDSLFDLSMNKFDIEKIGFDLADFSFLQDEEKDESDKIIKDRQFILEITFPNEQLMMSEYHKFLERGLIAKVKG